MTEAISASHLQKLEQAPAGTRVFLDLDRTLILGYSLTGLLLEAARRGKTIATPARRLASSLDRGLVGSGYTRLYKRAIASLADTPADALRELGQEAFELHIAPMIYREARELIRQHRANGHELVIVSAATQFQVEPVAKALGIEEFYCTRLAVADDLLTGEIEGHLCHGEGKLMAARASARRAGTQLSKCWFYSDSCDDLPLLRKVGHPVATNPNHALREQAVEKGWAVLDFSSRSKPNLESALRTVLTAGAFVSTAAINVASRLFSGSDDTAANRMSSWFGDLGVAFSGIDIEVEGLHHLESVRPAIFVFNHQSYLDSIILAYLLRHDFVALVKKEVGSTPLLGSLMTAHGTIFVDREQSDQRQLLTDCKTALSLGKSLVIAPEGTRSATGELQEFKQGAIYLAKKMQVPIVPIVLHNTADCLPKGGWLLRSSDIRVTVLEPIPPEQLGRCRQSCSELQRVYEDILGESERTLAA